MYPFVRGKKPISKTPLSTGEKLGTGKLDNRLFDVNLVSPTDGSVVLVGNGYNGKFEGENPESLDGYMLRKSFKLPMPVPENGVLLVKFVYDVETVGDLDGYEIINNQLWYKVHLDLLAKWDFRDIRIARNGTTYPYEFISKVDGQYALVAVKITEALSKNTKIYFYTGNNFAEDASTTHMTKIDNVVGAWTMDEENTEDPVLDYSGNGNNGDAIDAIIVDSPFYAGKKGREFNGTSSRIRTPACSLWTPSTESLSVIIKLKPFTGIVNYAGIISKGERAFTLRHHSDGRIDRILYTDNETRSAEDTTSDTWGLDVNCCVALTFNRPTSKVYIGKNGVLGTPKESTYDNVIGEFPSKRIVIGVLWNAYFKGIIQDVIITTSELNSTVISSVYLNYPDPRIEEGKIYIRKYVQHLEPEVDTFGEWTSRRSYGTKSIYPSQGDCSVSVNWQDRYLEVKDIWVKNELTETADATVLYDGVTPYFSKFEENSGGNYECVLTEEDNRVKVEAVEVAEGTGYTRIGLIKTVYSEDWSDNDFLIVQLEGTNSGQIIRIRLDTVDWTLYEYTVVDDFTGKRTFTVPLAPAGDVAKSVRYFRIYVFNVSAPFTFYLYRVSLDNGNWATLSVNIPDVLQQNGVLGGANKEVDRMEVWVYNPSTEEYAAACSWDGANYNWRSDRTVALDGQTFQNVYGETATYKSLNCAVMFYKGKCGETKGRIQLLNMANRTHQYNQNETKFAKAIAVKLKPNANDYSATTGGNQLRLMFKIYFK